MKLVELTRPDGESVWIAPEQISWITPMPDGMGAPDAKTAITFNNGEQCAVMETATEVIDKL